MALMNNWVRESVSGVPGTGTITLGGNEIGFIKFEDAFVTTDVVHYAIEDGNNREMGIGTLTTGSPWTLARTTVLETLVSGTYDNTSPTAITLTSAAIVGIAGMTDMPGTIVGSAITEDNTWQNTALNIPVDATIPQNTEGFELMTVTYTPKYANSLLRVTAKTFMRGTVGEYSVMALFKDSTADALKIAYTYNAGTDQGGYDIYHEETISATTAVTFKIRVGMDTGTTYINGSSTINTYGASVVSFIKVEEIRQ